MSTEAAAVAAPATVVLTRENASDLFHEAVAAGDAEASQEAPPAEPEGQREEGNEEVVEAAPFDVAEVKKLLKGKKLEEAAKLLGVDVADLGIDPREHRALRKAAQRAERAQEELATVRQQVETEKAKVRAASEHFGAIAEKYKSGDYSGAIEALFGRDLQQVQALIDEQHSDPTRRELMRMKRELEEQKRAKEEASKAEESAQLTRAQEAQVEAYLDDVAAKLPAVAAKYAPLAGDRRFLRAVFNRQAEHFRTEGEHLPLGKAVRETAEEIRHSLGHWRSLLTEDTSSPSGGSAQSSARGAPPKSSKSVARSQGGTPKPVTLTRENAADLWAATVADI